MRASRKLYTLIIISFCVRLLIANIIELGNDEVYYYTYALNLQWNYFDHPPGVALLIRLTTLNLWLTSEVFLRLGSIMCAAVGTWLCFKTGTLIKNERTGFYAAFLYNTSIYTSIIAGTFILPDSPQVIFWLAALYMLLKIVIDYERINHVPIAYWLIFGLLTGICIQCKVHGVFLWFGLGLYILVYNRRILALPGLYLSFIITATVISPIVVWNINNHFITWIYHSTRVEVHGHGNFLQAFFGQIFYNNPINVFLTGMSIVLLPSRIFLSKPVQRILILTGLPIVIIVTILSVFNTVLPHWSGPGFLTLSFIAAAYFDSITMPGYKKIPSAIRATTILILVAVVGGISVIKFYHGTLSVNKKNIGAGDFTLDLSGWESFELAYKKWLLQQKENSDYSKLKIVCNKWFPASHIEYYVARPLHTTLVGIGNLNDLHNFAWLNHARIDLKKGEDALVIIPGNYSVDVLKAYGNYFTTTRKLQTFIAKRNGKPTRYFTVYIVKNYQHIDEVHNITVN